MSKEKILETFKDINYAYNNASMYDTLKYMLDELEEEYKQKTLSEKEEDYDHI